MAAASSSCTAAQIAVMMASLGRVPEGVEVDGTGDGGSLDKPGTDEGPCLSAPDLAIWIAVCSDVQLVVKSKAPTRPSQHSESSELTGTSCCWCDHSRS